MREFSPDGFWWWDGTTWRPSTEIEMTPQTEFERLNTALTPLLGETPLADLKDENLAYLAQQAKIDQQRLVWLWQAALRERETRWQNEAQDLVEGFGEQAEPD